MRNFLAKAHFPLELLSNFNLESSISETDGDLEMKFETYKKI